MYTIKYSQKEVEEKLDSLNTKYINISRDITQHNTNINTNKENIATLNTKVEDIEKVVTELNKLPKQNTTYSFIVDQRWLNNSSDPDMLISDPFIVNKDGSRTSIRKATDPKASTYENLMLYLKKNTHAYFSTFNSSTGIMTLKQLSDTNRLKYKNGKDIDKTKDHNVFIKFPCDIYYKSEAIIPPDESEVNEDYILVTISIDVPSDEDLQNWQKYSQYDLIAVYNSYKNGARYYSISGVKPTLGISHDFDNAIYRHMGSAFSGITYEAHTFLAILLYAYYNSVLGNEICGYGTPINDSNGAPKYPRISGLTDKLGMTDTDSTTGNGMTWSNIDYTQIMQGYGDDIASTNFWGLENIFGECDHHISNIVCVKPPFISNYIETNGSILITKLNGEDVEYTTKESFNADYNNEKHGFFVIYDRLKTNIVRAVHIGLIPTNVKDGGVIKKLRFGKHCDFIPKELAKNSGGIKYYYDITQLGNYYDAKNVVLRASCGATGGSVTLFKCRYESVQAIDSMGSRMMFLGTKDTIVISDN